MFVRKRKKNVDDHWSTQKKIDKKEKKIERAKNFGLLILFFFVKNEKRNSFTVLRILSESRKEGWHIINV